MSTRNERERLEKLRELVAYHRRRYHTEDNPEISDQAYDALMAELASLEERLEGRLSTVSNSVGDAPSEAFAKVRHVEPQWSFDNIFNYEELGNWEARLTRYLMKHGVHAPRPQYVAEHKIDGLKVVLEYRHGVLYKAATRGDGVTGEDVTHTARTISVLPHRLTDPVDLICVGEVWLPKSEFRRINEERKVAGEPLFANPRNAAAGSLRQLDPAIAASRKLSVYVYDIDRYQGSGVPPKTQWEELLLLKQLGLPVNEYARQCESIDAIEQYYAEWKLSHEDLPYGVDGIVIKTDDVDLQKLAGYTAKSPRFGVAYKFPAVETTTVVEAIELQVGRTGVVTPVAHLRPVQIDGSTVARATLHNEDQIKRLDVRVGDTIVLRKAGDVIPEIVTVLKDLRPDRTTVFRFPTHVTGCGGDGRIERVPGTAAYRCVSLDSDFLRRQKLYYFVSKTALNIDGIGPKIIDALLAAGKVRVAADLFTLTKDDFLTLPGFKEKSADNAVIAIKKARTTTLPRLLVGLSIDLVGEETAVLLARHFKDIETLRRASYAELESIHGIGEVVASSLVEWQNNAQEQEQLTQLLRELQLIPDELPAESGPLAGKSVLFTGTLTSLGRTEAEALARRAGAKIVGSISKRTDYLVVGENPGSKREAAAQLGVPILSECDFLSLVAAK